MGSTLEHGIYLPSEGEKNCYQGLAGNWNKVDGALGDIAELKQSIESKFTKEIVTELPTEDINPFCIYMILKTDPETDNIYDEWVYINNSWEYLGNTKVDMTQYYTKQEVNQLPAVASGVTATKVGNYDAHIANGDIHVTANDKTKWTNSANTHVLRLALSALTPSTSDNSFSNLDDSTALKVGDKVMDTAGVLFEVTAIDTANSTFTIGTALIDLAQDSDVVHKSGNETIGGDKTFSSNMFIYNSNDKATTPNLCLRSSKIEISSQGNTSGDQNLTYLDKNNTSYAYVKGAIQSNGSAVKIRTTAKDSSDNSVVNELQILANTNGRKIIFPTSSNEIELGDSSYKWKSIFATNYYYGNDNVELSTKFVTTDTAQTISGAKTFSSDITLQGTTTPIIKTISNIIQDSTGGNESISWVIRDKTDSNTVFAQSVNKFSGQSVDWRLDLTSILNGTSLTRGIRLVVDPVNKSSRFTSSGNNTVDLGSSTNRWKDVQTNLVNGLEPSALGMPDLANGIDISSYITHLDKVVNQYTPPSNGWLSIRVRKASLTHTSLMMSQTGGLLSSCETAEFSISGIILPVIANKNVDIYIIANSLESAKFYPCQGNV